jgi:hypothetical protein
MLSANTHYLINPAPSPSRTVRAESSLPDESADHERERKRCSKVMKQSHLPRWQSEWCGTALENLRNEPNGPRIGYGT